MAPDLPALRLMLKDLERTVRTQIAASEMIDEKAAKTIGWNGLSGWHSSHLGWRPLHS